VLHLLIELTTGTASGEAAPTAAATDKLVGCIR